MQYHISRDGKTYGPYALPDLKQMVVQGQILPDDLCWTEGMSGWLPLRQALAGSTTPAPAAAAPDPAPVPAPAPQPQAQPYTQPQPYVQPQPQPYAQQQPYVQPQPQPYVQPQYQQPAAATPQSAGGIMPPSLHWGLVFLLSIVTCGIFGIVWMFIQAGFAKKIDAANKTMQMYLAYLAIILLSGVFLRGSTAALTILPLIQLGAIVIFWIGAFGMRQSLLAHYNSVENVGLRLSGVMTFFFSVLYFQYHLTRIANWKRTGRLG